MSEHETKSIEPNPGSDLLRRLLEASAESPLAEADPKSMDVLMERIPLIFNKKPLEVTGSDIADTVAFYRAKRAMFTQLAKERADKEPSKRGRKSSKPAPISTDDIDI